MAESRLGFRLVSKEVGGTNGGGSFVTPEGRHFLETYEAFSRDADACLHELFEMYFATLLNKKASQDKKR